MILNMSSAFGEGDKMTNIKLFKREKSQYSGKSKEESVKKVF